jgi:hypothetical protein
MKNKCSCRRLKLIPAVSGALTILLGMLAPVGATAAADTLAFQHHFIARDLPVREGTVGDYGLTSLSDLDRDGDMDFVLGGRGVQPSRLYWFEFKADDDWAQHIVGTNYLSDVGITALDVDQDGWPDLVASGVWYRNPQNPRTAAFERHVFAENIAGAHDVVIADMDGDQRPDVVLMGDERTQLNSIRWFRIPEDPRAPWHGQRIGDPVHGAIAPAGVGDIDGDGDADVVRADTWFENRDGKGAAWISHRNLPMGRVGPFGMCTRTVIADVNRDGRPELVVADADIVESRVAILFNKDGRGREWERSYLPQSFPYGSLHSLAVADFDRDEDLDIVANEQEELLPEGRENPRWILWENLGEGKRFAERIILDAKLGGHELQVGDVDHDGDVDICSKPWSPRPWNGNDGRFHVDFLENLLTR